MPTVEKISIALPAEMANMVRQAVETGEYASSSEVVRDALRDWNRRREARQEGLKALRMLWRQAQQDRSPGVTMDSVLDRLEKKYKAMVDAQDR